MSIMNFLRGRFTTFALLTLILGLHSGQVAARQVACDAHFAPLYDPAGNHVTTASCICQSKPHQDNHCPINTCSITYPGSYTHWWDLKFHNCYEGDPMNPDKPTVAVEQYFRYGSYVAAQDREDKIFYKCDYQRVQGNDFWLTCYDCP
ncbi:hypothetical protein MJO28_014014 [Puccinia striiformis f. sp. tritici]|uniref:Uncharacterized protein n=1 Tax=Puccinia striiformis f. sp. tritici TaxID=168172 RepID=A0ACC0DYZ1_9BASI|nr:hypothetical protein MJO28_014014 [Puccinia striiformis f. sp. tritici]